MNITFDFYKPVPFAIFLPFVLFLWFYLLHLSDAIYMSDRWSNSLETQLRELKKKHEDCLAELHTLNKHSKRNKRKKNKDKHRREQTDGLEDM